MIDDTKTRAGLIAAAQDFIVNNETINTALFGVVSSLPTAQIGCIAFENKTFDTANKNPWFSVFYRPNIPESRTIGACGIDRITGFLQIDINIPPNTGESVLIEWERKARLYFFHGKSFDYDGHKILVTSSGMSQGRHVENNYRKSLTVAFRADLRRNTN